MHRGRFTHRPLQLSSCEGLSMVLEARIRKPSTAYPTTCLCPDQPCQGTIAVTTSSGRVRLRASIVQYRTKSEESPRSPKHSTLTTEGASLRPSAGRQASVASPSLPSSPPSLACLGRAEAVAVAPGGTAILAVPGIERIPQVAHRAVVRPVLARRVDVTLTSHTKTQGLIERSAAVFDSSPLEYGGRGWWRQLV
jgi:hypothetical protein